MMLEIVDHSLYWPLTILTCIQLKFSVFFFKSQSCMKEESRLLSGICKKKLALIYTFKFRNSEDIYFKNQNVRTTVSPKVTKNSTFQDIYSLGCFWCTIVLMPSQNDNHSHMALHSLKTSKINLFRPHSFHFTHDFTFTFHLHALEKEMATHSSVLAWRIPGTREPGGLPSMGSHRVGHD